MAMKENIGIPRRQQLLQKLLVIFASLFSFFLGSHVYRILPHDEEGTRLDPLDMFINDALRTDVDPTLRIQIRQILSVSANLINIDVGPRASIKDHSYGGIMAEFCPLNFTARQDIPLFEDVVESSNCGKDSKNIIRVDLREVIQITREFDAYAAKYGGSIRNNAPTLLDLKGVVFHESRCGSSLAGNLMMALDPERNRVYSEWAPPESAMKVCGEGYRKCSVKAAANLFKDVIYMMGRSNAPSKENLFIVFHPESTRTMETFRTAFPTTPWIFLYREPIKAILSQGENTAFSLNPSPMVRAFVKKEGYQMEDVTMEGQYAIQLATFCLSALRNFKDADGLGLAVRYTSDLVDDLIDTIIPKHFHTPVDHYGKKRIYAAYEKSRYSQDGLRPTDHSDRLAPKSIRDVAKLFLVKSYNQLEASKYNIENCRLFKPSGVLLRCKEKYKH
ncbi:hypothetical protein ACHAXR_008332 [Thalassiosira sp. AJA248-18]